MTAKHNEHNYAVEVDWIGNLGQGTANYKAYSREHEIKVIGKPVISGSADPSFRGDRELYSPEEMLVASLSACHMLWYLHLCADAGIVVVDYHDRTTGLMIEEKDGSGHFQQVSLQPQVKIAKPENIARAIELHDHAHAKCFIANSVNFAVTHQPTITAQSIEPT
ncbi:OsmC family protein [Thalassoporum mexicanum PCC 7367]|uniref:OsmC family protein n=1 Tax=Thalassoporum mexicanum TaxID=3457544 RepID=UPI00029FB659|nr:OsmC family protein [Pseudanabaena sp. PCC 7367]AFY68674.1 OsmC family protein [Pseudanabaena sp. PCC 7367]